MRYILEEIMSLIEIPMTAETASTGMLYKNIAERRQFGVSIITDAIIVSRQETLIWKLQSFLRMDVRVQF